MLIPTVQRLGKAHQGYNVKAEYYPMVGAALLETFGVFLGPEWTPELRSAWTDAFTLLATTMIEAAKN